MYRDIEENCFKDLVLEGPNTRWKSKVIEEVKNHLGGWISDQETFGKI